MFQKNKIYKLFDLINATPMGSDYLKSFIDVELLMLFKDDISIALFNSYYTHYLAPLQNDINNRLIILKNKERMIKK